MTSATVDKARLTFTVTIEESLRVRMIELGVSPASVARAAIIRAVKQRENEQELIAVRIKDPRVKMEDMKSRTVRMRRLRGL